MANRIRLASSFVCEIGSEKTESDCCLSGFALSRLLVKLALVAFASAAPVELAAMPVGSSLVHFMRCPLQLGRSGDLRWRGTNGRAYRECGARTTCGARLGLVASLLAFGGLVDDVVVVGVCAQQVAALRCLAGSLFALANVLWLPVGRSADSMPLARSLGRPPARTISPDDLDAPVSL